MTQDQQNAESIVVDASSSVEHYTKDDRQSQTYYSTLLVHNAVKVSDALLPSKEVAVGGHKFFSKYRKMCNAVAGTAERLVTLVMAGGSLDEVTREDLGHRYDKRGVADLIEKHGQDPDESFVLSEENPVTGEPFRPFDELTRLTLSVDGQYPRYRNEDSDLSKRFTMTFTFRAYVERPSKNPSKKEMRLALSGRALQRASLIRDAFEKSCALRSEQAAHHKRVTDASKMAKHFGNRFRTAGDEEINLEGRKQALRQEREEAARKKFRKFREEHSVEELAEFHDCDPRAIEAALENWDEFVGFHLGGLRGSTTSELDPEKVE